MKRHADLDGFIGAQITNPLGWGFAFIRLAILMISDSYQYEDSWEQNIADFIERNPTALLYGKQPPNEAKP